MKFYDANGGVPQFGYPVTPARMEGGYLVQWTERQRLEYHPENEGTGFEVLLGPLGRELTRGYEGPRFQAQALDTNRFAGPANRWKYRRSPTAFTFKETGYTVDGPFLSYWRDKGALSIFGYPISNIYTEDNYRSSGSSASHGIPP